MNSRRITYKYFSTEEEGIQVHAKGDLNNFSPDMFGIGDLETPSKQIEVLSVIFDLEGFTIFTKQMDPQLAIPGFISDFFDWIFKEIRLNLINDEIQKYLWAELPFYAKFLGDGVLFLWKIDIDKILKIDSSNNSKEITRLINEFICNIVSQMYEVCISYVHFYEKMTEKYSNPPKRLRCGIARGNAFPIGNGKDFVGPCINVAARLQKFNGLSFCFLAKGIDPKYFGEGYPDCFIKKRVQIRGVGDSELIYILKKEFNKLSADLKKEFRD